MMVLEPSSTPQDTQTIELLRPCGVHCSNYEAEVVANQKTLNTTFRNFENNIVQPTDVVIFSDSQLAILAIDGQGKLPYKLNS